MTQRSVTPAPATRPVAPFFAPLQRELDRMRGDIGAFDMSEIFSPSPRMNLRETPDGIEIDVDVPGLNAEDLTIEFQDDILTLAGETRSDHETEAKGRRLVERRHGAFSRSVRLPAGVKPQGIRAALAKGVLTITAPLDPEAADRKLRIPIKAH